MDERRRRFCEECGREYPLKDEDIEDFFKWMQSKELTPEEFLQGVFDFQEEINIALTGVNYQKYKEKYVKKSEGD